VVILVYFPVLVFFTEKNLATLLWMQACSEKKSIGSCLKKIFFDCLCRSKKSFLNGNTSMFLMERLKSLSGKFCTNLCWFDFSGL
jgi:hypothetical protein